MEFIENEFEPKNETLKDLKAKIIKAGLSFHPYLAMQAINKEVETQLTNLIVNHFKGMRVEQLGKCNQEIKEYAEAEEARYQAFQKAQSESKFPLNTVSSAKETKAEVTKIDTKKKKK